MIGLRIEGLHARRFLSFEHLDVQDLDPHLTVVVGPNGSGKTNLLRVVQEVRHAVTGTRRRGESPTSWFSDPADTGETFAEAALDVVLDSDYERRLLRDYFASALCDPDELNRALDMSVVLNADGYYDFCRAVNEALTLEVLEPLYKGRVSARWFGDPQRTLINYFTFELAGQHLHLYLGPGYSGFSPNLPVRAPITWGGNSLAWAFSKSQPPKTLEQVQALLRGDRGVAPRVGLNLEQLLRPALDGGTNLIFQTGNPPGQLSPPTLAPLHVRLGVPTDRNIQLVVGAIFRDVFERAVRDTANRRVDPRRTYPFKALVSGDCELRDGSDLALHLLRLKNGSPQQRDEYRRFRQVFSDLAARREIEVTASPPVRDEAGGQQTDAIDLMVWVMDEGHHVPLQLAGAGMAELAMLSALAVLPEHRVVLLDEPGANLHPGTQRRLAKWLQSASGQFILVTHSPFLVDADNLGAVRRVSRRGRRSEVHDFASVRDDEDMRQRIRQMLNRSGDAASLLFASAVLLVEGETEQGAAPVWFQRRFGRPPEDLNARVFSIGSKSQLGLHVAYLSAFAIPWVALVDGDALTPGPNHVIRQLRKGGIDLSEDLLRAPADDQARSLANANVFLVGQPLTGKFETAVKIDAAVAPDYVGRSKVRLGMWAAETIDPPKEFLLAFHRLVSLVDPVWQTS